MVLTRHQVAASLMEQGDFSIETGIPVRTLTYWRSTGHIGSMLRDGNRYYMQPEDQDKALFMQRTRQTAVELVLYYEIEGDAFDITKIELTRRDGKLLMKMFTKEGDFLIKELEEEALNGLQ